MQAYERERTRSLSLRISQKISLKKDQLSTNQHRRKGDITRFSENSNDLLLSKKHNKDEKKKKKKGKKQDSLCKKWSKDMNKNN